MDINFIKIHTIVTEKFREFFDNDKILYFIREVIKNKKDQDDNEMIFWKQTMILYFYRNVEIIWQLIDQDSKTFSGKIISHNEIGGDLKKYRGSHKLIKIIQIRNQVASHHQLDHTLSKTSYGDLEEIIMDLLLIYNSIFNQQIDEEHTININKFELKAAKGLKNII